MKKVVLALIAIVSSGAFATEVMKIPSDPKGTYTILEKDMNGSMATIVTKREGPAGTTYSKRLYDCSSWTVKYLGTGESLEQMNSSEADKGMSPIGDETIAYYVGRRACN
ncbi:hypothetical protein L9H89_003680 [Klebsiella aerogenes]|nr:hypothetical protein [Klebsiella aerogenes]